MNKSIQSNVPDKKIEKIENKIQKADNISAVASLFCSGFLYLLKIRRYDLLSDFISSHLSKMKEPELLRKKVQFKYITEAVDALDTSNHYASAKALCDYFGLIEKTIEILAKRGRANDLAMLIANEQSPDKRIIDIVITTWEKTNGNISSSPAMADMVRTFGKFYPEYLPDNPRVKEITGQLREAAFLYEKECDYCNAARCYEEAGMYEQAGKIYMEIKDYEGFSRTMEAIGDLEKALEFVVKPERKINLLILMEKFAEAREFAAGLEEPDKYFEMIRVKAGKRMEIKIRKSEYIEAMELAEIAECDAETKEEILSAGRKYYDQQLIGASSDDEIKKIYRDRIKLEEKAGDFEEAGIIAEEILKDLELASLLYEKANLYNRAIHATSESQKNTKDETNVAIRLANLHEKGGNLLNASRLYEQSGFFDKAYVLYEKLKNYKKAIECYIKAVNTDKGILADLYIKNAEYEKAIELYLADNTVTALEAALSIAKTYNLATHIKEINGRMARFIHGNESDLKKRYAESKEDIISSYSPVLGIDFGTTNSVGAFFNKRTRKAEIITTGPHNRDFEPSFFGLDENNGLLVGEKARLRSLTAPGNVVARVKRTIGEGKSFSIGNKNYKSEEIVARIIQKIKLNAEEYLKHKVETRFREKLAENDLRFPEESILNFLSGQDNCFNVEEVVLTVPAFFNDNKKRAIRDSAEIAGLKVLRLLHEPTAAALAYGYQRSYSGNLAVVDLGGGTLDISILTVGDGVYEIVNIYGDTKLGGSDIDEELLKHVREDIKRKWNIELTEKDYPVEINRLRDACENLKINLSFLNTYTMELAYFLNKQGYTFTLTRKDLERIAEPVLKRIKDTVSKAVKESNLQIDHFLLVGHATKMPAVVKIVSNAIHAKHATGVDPGSIVASGAALQGAIKKGDLGNELLLDVVPYSLGIAVLKKDSKTGEEEFSKLIERNTTIPTRRSQEYTTTKDNQTSVQIKIYQGEFADPKNNYFLGDFFLQGIAPAPAGTPKIDVRFDIGADCILTVTAKDKATDNQHSIRIENIAALSFDEKTELKRYFEATESMNTLKARADRIQADIGGIFDAFGNTVKSIDQNLKDLSGLFHEKIEINARLYKATNEQTRTIQDMFLEKDRLNHMLQKYKDEAASIKRSIQEIQIKHLDFSDNNAASELQERIDIFTRFKESLIRLNDTADSSILDVLNKWMQTLKEIEPDEGKMDSFDLANYYFVHGKYEKARETLDALSSGREGLNEEAFQLLLKCYNRLCMFEEYRSAHKKYAGLFKLIYPDFNGLHAFLNNVDESVFMIRAESGRGTAMGSGFCIAPNLIATNRHVVEGAAINKVAVYGKRGEIALSGMEIDPVYDLAILRVKETLPPFRLGVFGSVMPGEQIVAMGFPSPTSHIFSENIYISKGIVNSIRNIREFPERVIFIDAKIGSGMSGGPLINELGEVVGIITMIQYEVKQYEKGVFATGEQPVALPVHIIENYLL